jgi:Aldehyde dehydrogenase family
VPKRQQMALGYASHFDAERRYAAANGQTFVLSRPYGVVVSIVPWNSPDFLAFTQIVAALSLRFLSTGPPPYSVALPPLRQRVSTPMRIGRGSSALQSGRQASARLC